MSDYYIKGIKDDRFKVKNQKTLELSEDEINNLVKQMKERIN